MYLRNKVILFGASILGEKAYEELQRDYSILYFCDNSLEKWNKNFCGCKVISPKELIKINRNDIDILITSMYWEEIAQQLTLMGIRNIKIYSTNSWYEQMLHELGFFNNILYYNKKRVATINNNCTVLNKVKSILFIIDECIIINELYEIIKLLYINNFNICILLVTEKLNLKYGKENVYTEYCDFYEIKYTDLLNFDFYIYDIIEIHCNNEKIEKILNKVNKPIVNFINNNQYIEKKVFFHKYIHEMFNSIFTEKRMKIYEYDVKKEIKIINNENSLIIPIKYNGLSEYIVKDKIEKIVKKSDEIHCILICNNNLLKCEYSKVIINAFVNENIHIHIYTNEKYISNIIENKFIHKEKLSFGKKLITEIKKYDYAISTYLLSEDKFFVSDIIDNNLSQYMCAGIPVIVDYSLNNENGTQFYTKYNNIKEIKLDISIKDQLIDRNVGKSIDNKLMLDNYTNEICKFYNEVNKSYFFYENEEQAIKPSIALRILTRNRVENLKKSISFYLSMENVKITLYILDGSEGEYRDKNIEYIDSLNNSSIVYISFEKDIGFYRRLYYGIENISEKYLFNCADDDYFTEKSLLTAYDYLEKNIDFGMVKGLDVRHKKNYLNDFLIIRQFPKILEDEDGIIRANNIYCQLNSNKRNIDLIYGAFRRDIFQRIASILNKKCFYEMSNIWKEYFGYIITAYISKIKFLDNIVHIREANEFHNEEYAKMIINNRKNIISNNTVNLSFFSKDIENMKQILTKEKINLQIEEIVKSIIKSHF